MNTIETYTTESPFGIADECSKITINDVSLFYVIPAVMTMDAEYTLCFWIRSDNGGVVSVCGSQIETSTSKWEKQAVTFTAYKQDLTFAFSNPGVYYIYRVKLEIGNKATDWTPAPEDVDRSIDDLNESVNLKFTEHTTSIIQTCEGIVLSAAEKYVDTSTYNKFRKDIQAQLSLVADEIAMEFKTTEEDIGILNDRYSEINKRISFTQDGIAISAGERETTLYIDNDVIMFEKDGILFGRWTPDEFNTRNIRVEVEERAQFGNFAFVPRSDGSLSFLKVENNANFYARHVGSILYVYGAHPTMDENTLVIDTDDIPSSLSGTILTLGGS